MFLRAAATIFSHSKKSEIIFFGGIYIGRKYHLTVSETKHILSARIKICKQKGCRTNWLKEKDNLNLFFSLPRGQLPNYLNLISLLCTAISKCKSSIFHIRATVHWFWLVEFFPPWASRHNTFLTAKIAKQLFFSIRVYDSKSNTSEFVLCRRSQRESINYRITVLLELRSGLHSSRPVFLVQQRVSRWLNFSVRWRIFFSLRLGKYTSFISCQNAFPL